MTFDLRGVPEKVALLNEPVLVENVQQGFIFFFTLFHIAR